MNGRIIPTLALLLAIGIFFGYVNFVWTGSIATSRASIAADDETLAAAHAYSVQQNQLASARDAIDPANITALSTFLPDSVDNVGLILDLNALAARSQLSVANVDVIANTTNTKSSSGGAPMSGASPVGSVDLDLAASGTFDALQKFLGGVERSARILDIHDLTVTGSDTGVYDYKMTLRLYWLR